MQLERAGALERALGEMERELVFSATMECALATGAGGGGMAEEDDTFFLSFTMLYRKIHRNRGKRQKRVKTSVRRRFQTKSICAEASG